MKVARVNIYGFPHKGLRNALGQLSLSLGNLDIDNQEAIKTVVDQSLEISELLKLHLQSEESHVLPHLEREAPGSTQHNHEDHENMERLEKDMISTILELTENASQENVEKAYNKTNLFIREYFRHMDEEETDMNQIIWKYFSDMQILEWQGKILSTLTPEQMNKWFKYIIPALSPLEQNIILGEFKQNAPREAYEFTMNGMYPYVTERQYQHIQTI